MTLYGAGWTVAREAYVSPASVRGAGVDAAPRTSLKARDQGQRAKRALCQAVFHPLFSVFNWAILLKGSRTMTFSDQLVP